MRHLWQQIYRRLAEQIQPEEFNRWIQPLQVKSLDLGKLTLEAPSPFHRDWVRERYLDQILSCCRHLDRKLDVELIFTPPVSAGEHPLFELADIPWCQALEPTKTFASLKSAPFNYFAIQAAKSFSKGGARGFAPLFLQGGSGLGKTHLLHAIGNTLLEEKQATICYMSCRYINIDWFGRLSEQGRTNLQKTLATADALLLDDVDFLPEDSNLQQIIVETFNHLYHQQLPVACSARKLPKDICHLSPRMRSRLGWGLVARIEMPEEEDYRHLARRLLEEEAIPNSSAWSLVLAEKRLKDLNDLLASVEKIKLLVEKDGSLRDLAKIEPLLGPKVEESNHLVNLVNKINMLVSSAFSVPQESLLGADKKRKIVTARHAAMYLVRKLSAASYYDIAKAFGGKDHSTPLYAYHKMQGELKRDQALAKILADIEGEVLRKFKKYSY